MNIFEIFFPVLKKATKLIQNTFRETQRSGLRKKFILQGYWTFDHSDHISIRHILLEYEPIDYCCIRLKNSRTKPTNNYIAIFYAIKLSFKLTFYPFIKMIIMSLSPLVSQAIWNNKCSMKSDVFYCVFWVTGLVLCQLRWSYLQLCTKNKTSFKWTYSTWLFYLVFVVLIHLVKVHIIHEMEIYHREETSKI